MRSEPLIVGVTGDTGWNRFTHYLNDKSSDNPGAQPWHAREVICDINVPAAAQFATVTMERILAKASGDRIRVCGFLPRGSDSDTFRTFPQTLVFLKEFPWARGRVNQNGGSNVSNRIDRFSPFEDSELLAAHPQQPPECFKTLVPSVKGCKPQDVDALLIDDAGGAWRAHPAKDHPINRFLTGRTKGPPRIIVNTNVLPEVDLDASGRTAFRSPFWQRLARADLHNNVCVICSATMLRQAGARLSWRLSWEQTVEDLAMELIHFAGLRALSRFRHLIIRFGVVAAVHVETHSRTRTAHLVFGPLARDGVYRDRLDDGEVIGKNTLMAASIVKAMSDRSERRSKATENAMILEALQRGLRAGMSVFDKGYGAIRGAKMPAFVWDFLGAALHPIAAAGEDEDEDLIPREQTIGVVKVPCDVIQRPPDSPHGRRPTWQILGEQLNGREAHRPGHAGAQDPRATLVSRINLGSAIVKFGPENALNHAFVANEPQPTRGPKSDADKFAAKMFRYHLDRQIRKTLQREDCVVSAEETADHITLPNHQLPLMPDSVPGSAGRRYAATKISVPITEFGRLQTIERADMETFRSIHNLIKTYAEQQGPGAQATPISIAVFGAPGSGKSFAVKQIKESINAHAKLLEEVEYNVAQFRGIDDLSEAVTRLTSMRAQGKIPLVFFDEFDCTFEGLPLGWLKYFLAPMQDGMFYGARQTLKFGRAVFVFAGGVNISFDEFDPTSERRVPTGGHGPSEEFKQRVALFKSQKGPDFVSRLRGHIDILSINTREGHTKHVIRRAIILRNLILEQNRTKFANGCRVAEIDDDVLYALLTVDRYRHGARSLEAILQMCTPMSGRIEKSSLPSRAQLNMHVNADEFFIRMFRGRFRAPAHLEEAPAATTGAGDDGGNGRKPGQHVAADDGNPSKGERPPVAPQTKRLARAGKLMQPGSIAGLGKSAKK